MQDGGYGEDKPFDIGNMGTSLQSIKISENFGTRENGTEISGKNRKLGYTSRGCPLS